jgi:hypothetical protein
MIKIINNVLTTQDCFSLYQGLASDNIWNLNKTSDKDKFGGAFPGVSFIENKTVVYNNQYWIGYFNCLFDRINEKLNEQHNLNLVKSINRIGLNAQNDNHYTEFHADKTENTYSIVGFFTPQWAEEWGGELNVEVKVIKYNPGDFILFDSFKLHQSQKIKKIPYWRTSVSYVIEKK